MKKIFNSYKSFLVIPFIFFLIICLSSCNEQDKKTEEAKKEVLASPIVSVYEDGTITWTRVLNADKYEVYVDGVKELTTDGYSYEVKKNAVGDYEIVVIAIDTLGKYGNSIPSKKVYSIEIEKLATPVIYFDGNNVVWDSIINAENYNVFVDNTILENPIINEVDGREQLDLSSFVSGAYSVSVQAVSKGDYLNSSLSKPIYYYSKDTSKTWKASAIDSNWSKENSPSIMHILSSEIFIWVDYKGSTNTSIENYVEIPEGAKAFSVTGYKTSGYGAVEYTLFMKRAGGEYERVDYQLQSKVKMESEALTTYYWELPQNFNNGNCFIKIKMESTGPYQAQSCITALSFEEKTEYVEPTIPVNEPVVLVSVSQEKRIKYNNDYGYLTYSLDNDSDSDASLMFVQDTKYGEGYYRIKTQNGLYLTVARMLRENNVVNDYIVATPYNEELDTQVWFVRAISSIGGEDIFTILNYGCSYDDNGTKKYLVLDVPYAGCDNCTTYFDISHPDLEFIVKNTTGTFSDKANYIQSGNINFNINIIASFVGSNDVFDFGSDGYMKNGSLISDTINLSDYSWKLEEAFDGYYYVKLSDGKYLSTKKVGNKYYVIKADKVNNDDNFLWKFESRGGIFFYISNKFVNTDSYFYQYLVKDVDGRISFYTDLATHYDQIIRIANICE